MITFRLTGFETVVDRLSLLPKKLQRKAAKVAARRGMNLVRAEARKRARKLDDRDDPRAIWKNIRTQEATRSSRRVRGVVMRVGVGGGARLGGTLAQRTQESAGLPGGATQHWRLLEFGSENTPAHSFMRGAFAATRTAVEEKVAAELSAAITRLADSPPGAS